MLKKLVVGAMAMGLATGMLFGTDSFSYLRTFGKNVRTAVKSEITPEFELARIRDEVDNLLPEIRRHMTVVAEQSVDVKDMERSLADKESNLTRQKDAILALRSDLESGSSKFTYKAVSYTRGEVEADLSHRFESYRSAEDSIKRDRQILTAQKDTLRANQQKLDTMLSKKQDLVVKVAQLEARLKQVQAAEAVNCIEIDDSKLARVEQLIKDVNRQLDVRESMLETEGHIMGRIPVEDDSPVVDADVLNEIDAHFGLASDANVAEAGSDTSI
ncbi:MAG: hypothetical protein KDA91_14240 [Planctomycetaceae bacterium]|nr:hypothetical protein [Planctomycetaceae bacterium]